MTENDNLCHVLTKNDNLPLIYPVVIKLGDEKRAKRVKENILFKRYGQNITYRVLDEPTCELLSEEHINHTKSAKCSKIQAVFCKIMKHRCSLKIC